MSRRRHDHEEHEEHPDERWLVSYADMITVLMILFIMLYSVSSVNISKYQALQRSTAEALGSNPPVEDPPPAAAATSETDGAKPKEPPTPAEEIVAALQAQIRKAGLSGVVEVSQEARGVVIRFSDRVLFARGEAQLTRQGRGVLAQLSPVLDKQRYPLVIEGHTDTTPIRTAQFPSNWELSTYRSTSVLHYLLNRGIPGTKMSAAGYADTHPRASNRSERGRATNRRVEIVVQAPVAVPAKATTGGAATAGEDGHAPSPATPAPTPAASSGHGSGH